MEDASGSSTAPDTEGNQLLIILKLEYKLL